MKKIFIAYAHYDEASFNASIKKTFIETAKEKGHEIDCVDLYKEKFNPVYECEEPDEITLNHRNLVSSILKIIIQLKRIYL